MYNNQIDSERNLEANLVIEINYSPSPFLVFHASCHELTFQVQLSKMLVRFTYGQADNLASKAMLHHFVIMHQDVRILQTWSFL